MLTFKGITNAANSYMSVRLNNDSTSGNYAQYGGGDEVRFLVSANSGTKSGGIIIYDANQAVSHKVEATPYDAAYNTSAQFYLDPVAITRVDLISRESQAFTGGTVYLYGIAA